MPILKGLCQCMLLPMLASVPTSSGNRKGICEQVDMIELNHFYDDQGQHQYDQVIFYEWSPDYGRFHVIAWSLIENDFNRMPVKLPGSGEYSARWYDRDAGMHREVRSPLFRESWSQVDPERANKKLISEKYRVSLLRMTDRTLR